MFDRWTSFIICFGAKTKTCSLFPLFPTHLFYFTSQSTIAFMPLDFLAFSFLVGITYVLYLSQFDCQYLWNVFSCCIAISLHYSFLLSCFVDFKLSLCWDLCIYLQLGNSKCFISLVSSVLCILVCFVWLLCVQLIFSENMS